MKSQFSRRIPLAPMPAKVDFENYVDWVAQYGSAGRELWMLTFQFNPIHGSPAHLHEVMKGEIRRIYSMHATRVNKYPNRGDYRNNLPLWIMVPDWPVAKGEKRSVKDVTFNNGGLHYAGICVMPLVHHLKEPLNEHFDENGPQYVREPFPLLRMRADRISETPRRAISYTFKSLKRCRATSDEVFILPFALSELGHHV